MKKVIAELEVGTGDAAQSGIVSGLAWTLLGNLMSIFTNVFKTCRFRYNVKTNFSKAVFNMDFFCIFSIKIVNIIVVGMRLAVLFLKNRDKLKKATGGDMFGGTSDSRSYDYSDAEHQGHG
ncbi:MAG: DUF2953 domain-containing protein [Clostridia bacterium]|nr:DUF2953 domain-containing protein [Clostridia bacterium]